MKKKKGLKIGLCMLIFSMILSSNLVFAKDNNVKDGNIVGEPVAHIKEGITQKSNVEEDSGKTSTSEESKEAKAKTVSNAPIIWDGTSDTTWFTGDETRYEISTPEQLAGLAELVNNGNEMTDITFKLTSDIYLNDDQAPEGRQWPMIGKNTICSFGGSIDGQDHTVYNVYVNEKSNDYAGFLGETLHAAPLKSIVITGSINGKVQAGVIGRISDNVTLDKITNKANIKGAHAAGIVTEAKTLAITDCINEGTITAGTHVGYTLDEKAGGILGYSEGETTMVNCHNKGTITGNYFTGGLIGYGGSMKISGSSNTGNITSTGFGVGGIIGFTDKPVTTSTNEGSVKGRYSVGGIVGRGATKGYTSVVECVNRGEITAQIQYAGGIVGLGNANISKCTNTGAIKVVDGLGGAGGIRGAGEGIIENSENSGDVTTHGDYVGGIQGNDSKADITKCTNTGNIQGNKYVGGIAGYGSASVVDCNNLAGEVTGTQRMGGIIGQAIGTVKGCTNKAIVRGKQVATSVFVASVGGIAGITAGTAGTIDTCTNQGSIYSNGNWTGGIVGSNTVKISNCENSGKIVFSGLDDKNPALVVQIGLITGWSSGAILDCVNKGDLDVEIRAVYYINNNMEARLYYRLGGISGCLSSATAKGCINTGNIRTSYVKVPKTIIQGVNVGSGTQNFLYRIGGIVGAAFSATVESSHNFGEIYARATTLDAGDATEQFYLGGIAGDISRESGKSKSTINECSNHGNIGTNIGLSWLGGISATASKTDITNCISAGNLIGDSTQDVMMGGICYQFTDLEDQPALSYKIENVYFAGKMKLEEPIVPRAHLLGIAWAPFENLGVNHAYYNKDVLGYQVVAVSGNPDPFDPKRATGLPTREMIGEKAKETMTNFDFMNTWVMHPDTIEANNNMRYYPSLKCKQDIKIGVKFYRVSFDTAVDYEIRIDAPYDNTGFILPEEDFEFTLNIKKEYQEKYKDMDCMVKDNGVEINPNAGERVYKLSNIQKDHKITVEFSKRTPSVTVPSVTFPSEVTIKYGESLKDAKFEFVGKGKMGFKEADRKLSVRESGQKFIMIFTPEDSIQYASVEKEVTVYVKPVKTNMPKDIHVAYSKKLKLREVTLPKGWSWKEPMSIVKVGTHTYKASFHDEEGNYLDETNVKIKIIMDKAEVKPPVIDPIEPSQPGTPNDKVETGDRTNIALSCLAVLLSLLSITLILIKRKKEK